MRIKRSRIQQRGHCESAPQSANTLAHLCPRSASHRSTDHRRAEGAKIMMNKTFCKINSVASVSAMFLERKETTTTHERIDATGVKNPTAKANEANNETI